MNKKNIQQLYENPNNAKQSQSVVLVNGTNNPGNNNKNRASSNIIIVIKQK